VDPFPVHGSPCGQNRSHSQETQLTLFHWLVIPKQWAIEISGKIAGKA